MIFENLSIAFISAAVKTTPRRQLCAHTYTSCACGINIPVCTIFQGPLAEHENSSFESKGDGNFASFAKTQASFKSFKFCFSTLFSI